MDTVCCKCNKTNLKFIGYIEGFGEVCFSCYLAELKQNEEVFNRKGRIWTGVL